MTDAAPSRSVSVRSLAILIGVLIVAGAIAVALLQVGRVRDLEDELGERDEVSTAAAMFGEVYLSYDFDDPDRSGERVLDLITPTFAEDFESTRAPAIEELFSNLGTTTVAETQEVFVGAVTEELASVLVVVDVTANSAASGTQELSNLTFLLELVNVDGQWLVNNVLPAPQPDITGDNVEASTTTTTAVP
jgi:Mce-associated membrane protein